VFTFNELEELAEMAIACAREDGTEAAWRAAVEECAAVARHYTERNLHAMAKRWRHVETSCRQAAALHGNQK
jgi:hypothetical protein